jgi:ketosteroid isomerase-like protein
VDVIAEVGAAFEAYEKALIRNDVDAIIGFFADEAVRYGLDDMQIGLA